MEETLVHQFEMEFPPLRLSREDKRFKVAQNLNEGNDDINADMSGNEETFDEEFMPMKHPPEPSEGNEPVNCPHFDSFFCIDGGTWPKELAAVKQMNGDRTDRIKRKRRHEATESSSSFLTPPRAAKTSFLQVFQQCKEIN